MAIEKHRKIKAIVASPEFFSQMSQEEAQLAARRVARLNQAMVEKDRLIKHQQIAIDLLTLPELARDALVQQALAAVARWRSEGLCSQDYIEKWEAMLGLPVRDLAVAMTSNADGWGPALRQNSPWSGVAR
ncbi:MAG TPA: type II toxin-antitoxin system Phd/YefM family antitoxin [Ideonella sp.]|uniref:type II toxin-antitoxin system Phd/YefM family antitoxin n=1 Tax=Ideonella sp. TaxID=1929293 RepID=UPI002C91E222|nr:type II toxin-antitoxin system Phd/YefM family antitoxin [Ideonella sp.]HSI51325.1 type II toxin-antitoxin system Phd/YefM family antitoxin [Ideonella sp.]